MTHELKSEHFEANARAALGDATLRSALRKATDLFGERRQAALGQVDNWEEMREEAKRLMKASDAVPQGAMAEAAHERGEL